LVIRAGIVTVERCNIYENEGNQDYQGGSSDGAGVWIKTDYAFTTAEVIIVTIVSCQIHNNKAYAGAGVYIALLQNPNDLLNTLARVSISSCTFHGNRAYLVSHSLVRTRLAPKYLTSACSSTATAVLSG
jgi:hypothetical protein